MNVFLVPAAARGSCLIGSSRRGRLDADCKDGKSSFRFVFERRASANDRGFGEFTVRLTCFFVVGELMPEKLNTFCLLGLDEFSL